MIERIGRMSLGEQSGRSFRKTELGMDRQTSSSEAGRRGGGQWEEKGLEGWARVDTEHAPACAEELEQKLTGDEKTLHHCEVHSTEISIIPSHKSKAHHPFLIYTTSALGKWKS